MITVIICFIVFKYGTKSKEALLWPFMLMDLIGIVLTTVVAINVL